MTEASALFGDMDNTVSTFSGNWQEWTFVLGYVAFAVFIVWRVFIAR